MPATVKGLLFGLQQTNFPFVPMISAALNQCVLSIKEAKTMLLGGLLRTSLYAVGLSKACPRPRHYFHDLLIAAVQVNTARFCPVSRCTRSGDLILARNPPLSSYKDGNPPPK